VWVKIDHLFGLRVDYFPIHTLPNIKLIDFGNAIPLALNTEYNKVQSLPYRAPEVRHTHTRYGTRAHRCGAGAVGRAI
jgi:serine/threonine protein kinase